MLEMYPETNWNDRRMGGTYLIFFWWISMTNSDSCSLCCLFKERFRNCHFLYLFSSSLLKNLLLTEDGSYRTPLVLCGSSQSGHREGTQTVLQECGSIFRFVSQTSTHTHTPTQHWPCHWSAARQGSEGSCMSLFCTNCYRKAGQRFPYFIDIFCCQATHQLSFIMCVCVCVYIQTVPSEEHWHKVHALTCSLVSNLVFLPLLTYFITGSVRSVQGLLTLLPNPFIFFLFQGQMLSFF